MRKQASYPTVVLGECFAASDSLIGFSSILRDFMGGGTEIRIWKFPASQLAAYLNDSAFRVDKKKPR